MFAVIPMLHYAAAHGVSTELPLRFGRLDDVSLSKQSIQTGETITITGKIVYMVQKHTQGWLTIHYDPGPYGRWTTISTQPSEHLIDIPGNSLIPFSITIKAFQPGTYHFLPEVYLVGIGPAMSSLDGNNRTEPTVVVTGNPICKEGLVAISKTENGSTACIKPETAQKLVGRGWGTFAPSSVDSTDNQTSSALKLLMSTDSDIIQPGKSIGITISVNNTLATPVDVPAQNNWSYPNVSTGPCQKINYGISILDGFYDKNNLTQGKSLNLFNSGIILCPNIQETAKMYEFQPSSGDVKQVQCKSIEGFQCETGSYQMGQNYKFDDYSDQGIVQPFKSGIYTLVGADEWGHVAIQHFVVTNSTIFAGDLGSMSCPAITGGVQFGATIKNSTGFANYYNSTQYSHTFFFLHPKMQGTINVQYTSPANAAWFQNNNNAPFNMTNGAALFYMANVTNGKVITSYAVSLYNDEKGHHSEICHYGIQYGGGFAEPCNTDNKGDIPPSELPEASKLLHPGISTSFEPSSVMLYPNSNPVFTAIISAKPDAMEGTYWLSLQRSLCGPGVLAKLVVLP